MPAAPDRSRGGDAPEELRDLERWVKGAVTGVPEAGQPAPGAFVRRLPNLDPEASLGVYREQWFARLRDCIAQDFPATVHALGGEEAFTALVRDFLPAHPPRHYDIALASEGIPAFLAAREGLERREFLADLARLEWAVTAVFDREGEPPLEVAALADLPPERFVGARFTLARTAEIHEFRHPVDAYLTAFRAGEGPRPPDPAPEAVLVFRHGTFVHRAPLDRPRLAVLRALEAGRPLGEALEAAAGESGEDPESLGPRVTGWFGGWVADGIFASVTPG